MEDYDFTKYRAFKSSGFWSRLSEQYFYGFLAVHTKSAQSIRTQQLQVPSVEIYIERILTMAVSA